MKKFFKQLFYVPKHEKPTDENILNMVLPAFFGIVMCATCLVGLTLAWFTASIDTPTRTLMASNFHAVTVVGGDGPSAVALTAESGADAYELGEGTHEIVIEPTGNGTGYCKVILGDKEYYTAPIKNEKFVFTVEVTAGTVKCTVIPVWGTYTGEANLKVGDVVSVEGTVTPDEILPTDPTDVVTPAVGGDTEDTAAGTEAEASDTTSEITPEDTTETPEGDTSSDTTENSEDEAPDTEAEETETETTSDEAPASDDGDIEGESN